MHPLLQTPKRLTIYVLAWVAAAAAMFGLLLIDGVPLMDAVILATGLTVPNAVLCLTPWYMCRLLPLRDGGVGKAMLNHGATAFIGAVLWTTGLRLITPGRLHRHLMLLFGAGILLYMLSVALHYAYLAIEESKEAIHREQEAKVLAREAELKALKAQINPHFLFNCLHSISALTSIDPEQAREMCIRLSDFLRNTLRMGEKASIPFAEELALVNTYLAVEQVRFGARLKVERDIGEMCDSCSVPPLLLQPLVENAVKHGIAGLVDGGVIRLHAACDGARLHIEVENDFDPDCPSPRKTGMGLANVRNRIATRHGVDGRLTVTVNESRHRVEVVIPCEAAERQRRTI